MPYTVNENAEEVIRILKDNKMKINPNKCHLLSSGKENRAINAGNVVLKNSINNIFIKTRNKLKALTRVASHMDLSKRKSLMNVSFLILNLTTVLLCGCLIAVQ